MTLVLTPIMPKYFERSFIASYKSIILSLQQDFMNCVHEPLFWDGTDEMKDELILHLVPPAELHLLIGPVNTMFEELEELWPEGSATWAKSCHAYKEGLHGGEFNGNSCMRLLLDKSITLLETMIPPDHSAYVDAFRTFGAVVESCYGYYVLPTFREDIEKFKESYLKLDISVTVKVRGMLCSLGSS